MVRHSAIGVVLVAAGLGVTLLTRETVWYGAVIVGGIEILRGLCNLERTAGNR